MLEDAEHRPAPDAIVLHPFFITGYMPVPSDITPKLRESGPRMGGSTTMRRAASSQALNLQTVKEMCRECGVGPWNHTQAILKPVWREVAAEESAGLTPVIPLVEGIVYRPFSTTG